VEKRDWEGTGVDLAIDRGIAVATLRSEPPAIMTGALLSRLMEIVNIVDDDPQVQVLILRSATPGFFACHFDVNEILAFDKRQESPHDLKPYHAFCERLRTMRTISIAVIEGRIGGGAAEIAFSCDMRFASLEEAIICQPEVAIGLIPGGSGTVRIPRLIGRGRALEVMLGCDDIDAATAAAWGLVNRALPSADLWAFVERLALRIASFPPYAVAAAKAAVVGAEVGVHEHLLSEAELFRAVLREPRSRAQMQRFMALEGQSLENENAIGAFLGGLGTAG
jgi:enoyl-CoA hydratase/carnithine racemase